jgi:hypothetical protein
LKIRGTHELRWTPCVVCTKPRATKQCLRCKAVRYCSMDCATCDFAVHKGECDALKQRRVETEAARSQAPKPKAGSTIQHMA